MSQNDLYIIDNASEPNTVKEYLRKWCPLTRQMDVATGYMEIGGLLELDGEWQKLDKIRILLGDEVTPRTKRVVDGVVAALLGRMGASVDAEQAENEFLAGVPAIAQAMATGKIECRVYTRDKFHAKAYITHMRETIHGALPSALNIPKGYALVGSSNFTAAGLTKNIELNVQIAHDVDKLQAWFEEQWAQGEDITEAVLKTIETRAREFTPHEVYLRAMHEYFKGHEETVGEWERETSAIYPILSQYQRDGYTNLVGIAEKHGGAFLCDGVGLGKTYVGLMLIERFVKQERRNVVLIVPASARGPVWETAIQRHMPELLDGFWPFRIINHTDLIRDKMGRMMDQIAEHGEVVIVDEAHHFRNRSGRGYRKFFGMLGRGAPKKLFLLTATPINNDFLDLQHMIELFTQRREDAFKALGVHSLSGHFRALEQTVDKVPSGVEAERAAAFAGDPLIRELVVQRSRAYVKRSLAAEEGAAVLFPNRKTPVVAEYSLKETCGELLEHFTALFDRRDKHGRPIPILSLPVYSPYEDAYYTGDPAKIDPMKMGRQRQVVALVRQLLLKRFESSVAAFQDTCVRIYRRLEAFLRDHRDENPRLVDRTFRQQADVEEFVEAYIREHFLGGGEDADAGDFDDDLPEYVWNAEDDLDRADFDIGAMIEDTVLDLDHLSQLIRDMMDFDPAGDDKLAALKRLLREEPRLKGHKVLVFTEYRATAKYLERELKKAGIPGVFEIDGLSKVDRGAVVRRFAPYYNGATAAGGEGDDIRVLIATDVLSEGLNLQDASRLVNYELHWNPVRLMQRIGRVDRRRSPEVEARLLADHPELAADRDEVFYWNFLPPDQLERLLLLYQRVTRKTLRISKVFGIEGGRLLTPEDDFAALTDFNARYEGKTSPVEEIALAYQQLAAANPAYAETLSSLPARMHSGKLASGRQGLFFCYALPVKKPDGALDPDASLCRWVLTGPDGQNPVETPFDIWEAIRCPPEEARVVTIAPDAFRAARKEVEKHLRNNYFRQIQAPLGAVPRLVAWMQLA